MWVSPRITAVPTRWLRLLICSSNIKFPILPGANAVQREFMNLSSCTYTPMLSTCESALFKLFAYVTSANPPFLHSHVYPIFTGTSVKTRWPRPPWARPSRREAASDWSPRKTSSQRGGLPHQWHRPLQRGRLNGRYVGGRSLKERSSCPQVWKSLKLNLLGSKFYSVQNQLKI